MQRPNILYLHSHDTGRYLEPYGHAVPTPNLRKLAEQGVLFRQAFCASPTCSPSRAALLTGQSAHSSGMLGLVPRGFALADPRQHLSHLLRAQGYFTALVGVQHEAADAGTLGYRHIAALTDHSAVHVAPAAMELLRSGPPQPFFVSVGFGETHRPFPQPSLAEDSRYTQPPRPLGDDPRVREDFAAFTASARQLDTGIGRVLDALAATGRAEDTLVIYTTDHGLPFPGMKCTLSDHGIGVALIVRGPGGFAGGELIDAMVSHVDLVATLCEYLHIEPPEWLEGKSWMPLIRGEVDDIHNAIFAEINYHAAYEPQRAVRTRRWKYIRRFDGRNAPIAANCDDSPSKNVWLTHGWMQRRFTDEQLFDLVFDPNEANNLAGRAAFREILLEMQVHLQEWMHATDDPLLEGAIPAPPGALVNSPDDLSPEQPPLRVG